MHDTDRVDIVLTWVDGNNPQWRTLYQKYSNEVSEGDKRNIRFRDWGLLKYWFRGIEAFAPWVGTIHLVTSGERPDWLDINHPKLHWVKHEDFMPEEFLPTFNINAIETNLHRIEGLSDQFIFFNDDVFLIDTAKESDFFRNNRPCDFAILDPIFPEEYPEIFVNDIRIINRHFSKREVINKDLLKWINPKYGKYLFKSILLLPWKKFPGLLDAHLAHSFRKETFEEVWRAEPEILHKTGRARFRSHADVNQWLFRFWHIAKGEFTPTDILSQGQTFEISTSTIEEICEVIRTKKYMQICINDGEDIPDFEGMSRKLQEAFHDILPHKSSFEIV
ncbi:Stealth-like protein [Dysgonomonas alginatilytica]|uniref:Stealth-like protein n=1 Tax=Dysgonomonas alginatilytica TaxID=1605892 RepID=A0A2V3PLV2_9BACT|nr:stealth conserved region 3 domain-containing protein [Dysgonomonas alginatilytica]PXV62336.1 Stealth-like protein [Dysgonomonas alginatilytica]